MSSRFLEGLNERQIEAVTHTEGPLLVLAGAGSGKTKVLTHRAGFIIEQGVKPRHILAITFTNKAAGQMRERIERILGSEAIGIWVMTFHSMCVRILRRDIDKIGYGRDFVIYDRDDSTTLIRNIIKKLGLDPKVYRERGMVSLISSAKNGAEIHDANVKKIYEQYERELKQSNALDFDDLLLKTLDLFKAEGDVLQYYRERFHYIMVDEYQDTNDIQFEIVRLLALGRSNLCVVGDDDQSIYRFRGANIENILSFERSFPGARVIKLEQNYRSTASILNAANEVISHNPSRKDKTLWTKNETGEIPVYREFENAKAEADAVARLALRRKREGIPLGSQAVLYRTNAQSRLFEESLITLSVPYIIVGGVNFYQRKEIKDMLSYLRLIANQRDDLSFRRVVNTPKRGIGAGSLDKIYEAAMSQGVSMFEAAGGNVPGISRGILNKVHGFTAYIDSLRARLSEGSLKTAGIIKNIMDEGGYEEELKREDAVEAMTRTENIEELIDKAVSFEDEHPELEPEAGLGAFLEEVSLIADIDRSDLGSDALTLMTLHAAKGLEFDTVYLCGMEEGLFPSAASFMGPDPKAETEEERRLCYVGITRAKRNLFLSSAAERLRMGEYMTMRRSRFIDEIPDSCLKKHFLKKSGWQRGSGQAGYDAAKFGVARRPQSARFGSMDTGSKGARFGSLDQSSMSSRFGSKSAISLGAAFTKTKPDYGAGDRVAHVKFGEGLVKAVIEEKKDYKVTVDFDSCGTKSMFAGFAKLKKL